MHTITRTYGHRDIVDYQGQSTVSLFLVDHVNKPYVPAEHVEWLSSMENFAYTVRFISDVLASFEDHNVMCANGEKADVYYLTAGFFRELVSDVVDFLSHHFGSFEYGPLIMGWRYASVREQQFSYREVRKNYPHSEYLGSREAFEMALSQGPLF